MAPGDACLNGPKVVFAILSAEGGLRRRDQGLWVGPTPIDEPRREDRQGRRRLSNLLFDFTTVNVPHQGVRLGEYQIRVGENEARFGQHLDRTQPFQSIV